jgi:hypothetical protein
VRLAKAFALHKPYLLTEFNFLLAFMNFVSLRWLGGRGILFLVIQMLLKTKNFASIFVNYDFLIVKLSN